MLKNQYLINENELQKFSSFFELEKGIPKYIIFDKKGNLILPNGPRPTNNFLFEMAINQLN